MACARQPVRQRIVDEHLLAPLLGLGVGMALATNPQRQRRDHLIEFAGIDVPPGQSMGSRRQPGQHRGDRAGRRAGTDRRQPALLVGTEKRASRCFAQQRIAQTIHQEQHQMAR